MSVQNLAEFERGLTSFSKTLMTKHMPLFIKKVALQLLERALMRTPVDTGQAANGWQISITTPTEDNPAHTTGIDISQVGPRAETVLATLRLGENVYVVNNVEYILHIEEGADKVAPVYMAKRAVQEIGGQF